MFTYPFCYTPAPDIVEAAERMIRQIDHTPALRDRFAEGKMLGVLKVRLQDGGVDYLYAFSGLAGGESRVPGFVPPIFDLTDPEGHYRKTEARISALSAQLRERSDPALARERKALSVGLQDWLFDHYIVHNARGGACSIREVFARKGLVPPGGTGDCAGPKLLEHAYRRGLEPLAMGEFWYGASSGTEIRIQGRFYPSCAGKCGPLLGYMLEGLDVDPNPLAATPDPDYRILFEDDTLIVADKPSGMLCVPGKTGEASLQERLAAARPDEQVYACHRLDRDTSGLIVYAKTLEAQADIERQFQRRTTRKSYIARLSGGTEFEGPARGLISIPIQLDYYDRPRRMVDFATGKPAETEYEILRRDPGGELLVRFVPRTGRTHQLRVHAAHRDGLARPILGDPLYGGNNRPGRLCLHAESLAFTHPRSGKLLEFRSDNYDF